MSAYAPIVCSANPIFLKENRFRTFRPCSQLYAFTSINEHSPKLKKENTPSPAISAIRNHSNQRTSFNRIKRKYTVSACTITMCRQPNRHLFSKSEKRKFRPSSRYLPLTQSTSVHSKRKREGIRKYVRVTASIVCSANPIF
jgi:hypothetical protein